MKLKVVLERNRLKVFTNTFEGKESSCDPLRGIERQSG